MIDEKKFMEFMSELEEAGAEHVRFDDLRKFVDEFPKIGGWILCSERLPEVEQTVLLSLRSLDVSVGFRANTDGYFYTEGEGYVLYENVLAWQPLPEAYHE